MVSIVEEKLHLLEEQKNVFLVSCMEYKLLRKRVNELFDVIKEDYSDLNTEIYIFSTSPRKPQDVINGLIYRLQKVGWVRVAQRDVNIT